MVLCCDRYSDQLERAAVNNIVCVWFMWKELLLVNSVQMDTAVTSSCFIVNGLCE